METGGGGHTQWGRNEVALKSLNARAGVAFTNLVASHPVPMGPERRSHSWKEPLARISLFKAYWGSGLLALSPRWLLVGRGSVGAGGEQRVAVADFRADLGTLEKTGFWGSAILGLRTAMLSTLYLPHSLCFPVSL